MTLCTIEDCERKRHGQSEWCNVHYMRWYRHGDPLAGRREERNDLTPEDRFWSRVDASGDCWTWIAGGNGNGYGRCNFQGRMTYTHRVAWSLLVGPIPEHLTLDHLCRNRRCVNPDHLEPVSTQENIRRGVKRNGYAERTHCPHGHPYSGVNLYIDPKRGWRQCRTCQGNRRRGRKVAV